MMATGSYQRKDKRYIFRAPVEMQWIDSEHRLQSVVGNTVDLSLSGLGVVLPVHAQPERELRIILKDVEVCGGAVMTYLQRYQSGFKAGLYFKLKLLMQNIPGVDEILFPPLSSNPIGIVSELPNLIRSYAGKPSKRAL